MKKSLKKGYFQELRLVDFSMDCNVGDLFDISVGKVNHLMDFLGKVISIYFGEVMDFFHFIKTEGRSH